MGSFVPKGYEKKSQKYWDSQIIQKSNTIEVSRNSVQARPILFSNEKYDTLNPEENVRSFCSFVRQALSRYEYNKSLLMELESKMQDILHFIEMSKNKDSVSGYRLYKELCDVRRQRRVCKNEIELLSPIYETFHGTKMLDQLSAVQGECKKVKQSISNKGYAIRTDALDSFIEQSNSDKENN